MRSKLALFIAAFFIATGCVSAGSRYNPETGKQDFTGFDVIATDCSTVISEGLTCWDSDDEILYVGNGSSSQAVGSGGVLSSDLEMGNIPYSMDGGTNGLKFDPDNDNVDEVSITGSGEIQLTATDGLTVAGDQSRITSTQTSEFIDLSEDDLIKAEGVGGSDNTNIQVDLDGAAPVISSISDTSLILDDTLQLGQAGSDGQLVVYNELGATDRTITVNPSSSQSADITYIMPPTDGAASEFLQTNGTGTLVWAAVAGVTPSSGDITAVGDVNAGGAFTDGGNGRILVLNSGTLTFSGTGGINNENIKLDVESNPNRASLSTLSGVNTIDIPFSIVLANGEAITNSVNGVVAISGGGGVNNENLTINVDTADTIALSSDTSATDLTWGGVSLSTSTENPVLDVTKSNFAGTGLRVSATNSSSGSVTGLSSSASNSVVGGQSTGANIAASVSSASGTVTNSFGILSTGTKSGASILTNYYGLHASSANVSAGSVTNNWAAAFNGPIKAEGTTPTISLCGLSPSVAGGTSAFNITVGSGGVTNCTATFATAYANMPICNVSGPTLTTDYRRVVSSSHVGISSTADISGEVISVQCIGR